MKKGLGKGLGALIAIDENESNDIKEVKLNEVEPNTEQPRKSFDDNKLKQLAESVKEHGIVQPIIVKKEKNTYKIVAGERRWRAARIAGLKTIPVIVKEVKEKEIMEIALIENIQREDLNPIEEAEAYQRLMKEFNLTQEEISKTVGKSRSAIANSLRLLNLSKIVREYIIQGKLSSGHARSLIVIENADIQNKTADEIINKNLNVRETERLVKNKLKEKSEKKRNVIDEQLLEIEERFKEIFKTKVKLTCNKNKGKITIEYYSKDELDRIIEMVDNIM